MVYCKVTAAVCKQCNTVNFLGCREHRELLTSVYAKDEVHTSCSRKKCATNSYASKFSCISCKNTVHDVYRLTVSKPEINNVISAFHARAGGKAIAGMRMDSSLIACMECSTLAFPVVGKRLCVIDQAGQLLDGDDQPVDLAAWKAKLPHCKKRCSGIGSGPFARIDVRLDFGELEFVQDMIKEQKDAKWKDFFFEGKYAYEKRLFIPLSVPTEPFKGGPVYNPEVPPSRTHPIAIGICKCCSYVTFGSCIRHNGLLSKAHVQEDPLSVVVSCGIEGCQVDSTRVRFKCNSRRNTDVDWLHLQLSKTEAAYLKKAWYGSGLHYHSSLTFMTRLLYCRQCKSASFPGVENKLCERSKAGLLVADRRDTKGINIRSYKHSHTHIAGCASLGTSDALASRDITLVGDEIEMLQRYLPNSATGSWSEEVLRIRDVIDKKPSTRSDWDDVEAPPPMDPESTRKPSLSSSSSATPPPTQQGMLPYATGTLPPGCTVLIDPATGAPVVVSTYSHQMTYMPPPSLGAPLSVAQQPQPQLYPTLPYGMTLPQGTQPPVPADYQHNPFVAYGTMRPPGSDDGAGAAGYPVAAFGAMSLGSSSSAAPAVGGPSSGGSPFPTIPRHDPAFPPHLQQPSSHAPPPGWATIRGQPPQ